MEKTSKSLKKVDNREGDENPFFLFYKQSIKKRDLFGLFYILEKSVIISWNLNYFFEV